jgi:hypothetical protein
MSAGGLASRSGPAPEARHAEVFRHRRLGGREPAEVAVQSADEHHRSPPPGSLLLRCWSNSLCCFEGPNWSSEHSVRGIEPAGSAVRHYAGASIPIENGAVTGAKKASAIAKVAALAVPRDERGACISWPIIGSITLRSGRRTRRSVRTVRSQSAHDAFAPGLRRAGHRGALRPHAHSPARQFGA